MWRGRSLGSLGGELGLIVLFAVVFMQLLGPAGFAVGIALGLAIAEGARRGREAGR